MDKSLVTKIPSSGHINPSLLLVNVFITCGEEIVYAPTETYRAKIEPIWKPIAYQ